MYPTAQITLSPTPSHLLVSPEWPYCQQAQCGPMVTVKHSKAGLQTSSHPQNSASLFLGLQGLQQTPDFYTVIFIKWQTIYILGYCSFEVHQTSSSPDGFYLGTSSTASAVSILIYFLFDIFDTKTRDIHIECSKQFKWNSYFYVSGQSGPFWAVLKHLENSNMKFK